jgi:acyl carrier protein phosphodiesterase
MKSQSLYKHYGQWLGDDKTPPYKERLKAAIGAVLSEQPKDFNVFLEAMKAYGWEHKYGRGGVISFRTEGQEKYTRLRSSTLGDGYDKDSIISIIEDRAAPRSSKNTQATKVNLIIDIQQKMREGKGPAYEHWAKLYNLKQMAAALQYLQENDLLSYGKLSEKVTAAVDRFHDLSDEIKTAETAMYRNKNLKEVIIGYAKTRPIFEEYKLKKYSNKFLNEHKDEIAGYRAAQATMKQLLNGEKLPKMDALKREWQDLTTQKKALYSQYRNAQKDMREIIAVKHNIDQILGITDIEKSKEMER